MGQAQDRTGGASRFHRLVVARRDTTDVTVALAEGKQGDTREKLGHSEWKPASCKKWVWMWFFIFTWKKGQK